MAIFNSCTENVIQAVVEVNFQFYRLITPVLFRQSYNLSEAFLIMPSF